MSYGLENHENNRQQITSLCKQCANKNICFLRCRQSLRNDSGDSDNSLRSQYTYNEPVTPGGDAHHTS